jgi:hypothetical protein
MQIHQLADLMNTHNYSSVSSAKISSIFTVLDILLKQPSPTHESEASASNTESDGEHITSSETSHMKLMKKNL